MQRTGLGGPRWQAAPRAELPLPQLRPSIEQTSAFTTAFYIIHAFHSEKDHQSRKESSARPQPAGQVQPGKHTATRGSTVGAIAASLQCQPTSMPWKGFLRAFRGRRVSLSGIRALRVGAQGGAGGDGGMVGSSGAGLHTGARNSVRHTSEFHRSSLNEPVWAVFSGHSGLVFLHSDAGTARTSVRGALHVLVLQGDDSRGDLQGDSATDDLLSVVRRVLDPDAAIASSVTSSTLEADAAWSRYTAALLMTRVTSGAGSTLLTTPVVKGILRYVSDGGTLVVLGMAAGEVSTMLGRSGDEWREVADTPSGSVSGCGIGAGRVILVRSAETLSDVEMAAALRAAALPVVAGASERKHAPPSLSWAYAVFHDRKRRGEFLEAVKARGEQIKLEPTGGKGGEVGGATLLRSSKVSVAIVENTAGGAASTLQPSQSLLPVCVLPAGESLPKSCDFNLREYQASLSSSSLGRSLVFADVIGSTQTVLDSNWNLVQSVPDHAGLALVAGRQLSGRGRSGNAWLSPRGGMSVTAHQRVAMTQNVVHLQYACGLAAVQAVRSMEGYSDLNIRLKWPNDIYLGRDTKIGGVLVSSSTASTPGVVDIFAGCGMNVCNPRPTASLNEAINAHNALHSTSLKQLSVETILARFLSRFEVLSEAVLSHGFAAIADEYYAVWLHSGARVTVEGVGRVVIEGIDVDSAELVARRENSREVVLLQPGDSSFDMMSGMISRKRRR